MNNSKNISNNVKLGKQFLFAVKDGDFKMVKDCLKRGVSINYVDEFGYNALHHAILGLGYNDISKAIAMVEFLLTEKDVYGKQINIYHKNNRGYGVLDFQNFFVGAEQLITLNDFNKRLNILEFFLEQGVELNILDKTIPQDKLMEDNFIEMLKLTKTGNKLVKVSKSTKEFFNLKASDFCNPNRARNYLNVATIGFRKRRIQAMQENNCIYNALLKEMKENPNRNIDADNHIALDLDRKMVFIKSDMSVVENEVEAFVLGAKTKLGMEIENMKYGKKLYVFKTDMPFAVDKKSLQKYAQVIFANEDLIVD